MCVIIAAVAAEASTVTASVTATAAAAVVVAAITIEHAFYSLIFTVAAIAANAICVCG